MPTTRSADRTNIDAVNAQANYGDTVVLKAYDQSSPYTLVPKAGVTYLAEDWAENRVLKGSTGYQGREMGVHVSNALYLRPNQQDVTLMGVYHNTERAYVINALLVTANNFRMFDCGWNHRRLDGGRQIGITVQNGARGFRLYRCRGTATGQPGTRFDHALYIKDTDDWVIEDTIVQEGGYFPLHLYPYARNGRAERMLVYGGARCATFSGANDSSTGLYGYHYSSGNSVTDGIYHSVTGSIAETWNIQPDANNLMTGVYTQAGSTNVSDKPGLSTDLTLLPVAFKDPANGDFSYEGLWVGAGPRQLASLSNPDPTPDPDPVPDPDPDPDYVQQIMARLAKREEQLATVRAQLSLGEAHAGETAALADEIAERIRALRGGLLESITEIDS